MAGKNAPLLPQSELVALYNEVVLPFGVTITEDGAFHQVADKNGKVRDARLGDAFKFVAHFDMPDGMVHVGMAFPNHDGDIVLVVVPKSEIQSQLALDALADAGWTANMQRGLKSHFCDMYASVAVDLPRYSVVERNGMQDDDGTFVMDARRIGAKKICRVLPPERYLGFSQAGTVESWSNEVAAPCEEEPFLVMAICMGFAAPLKHVVLQQGAVLNFIGRTSTGKTTAVKVSASVFIDPSHGVQSWDASEPAIDRMIERFSSFLLPIDEILAGLNPKQHVALLHRFAAQKTKQKAPGFGGGVRASVLALSTEEHDQSMRRPEMAAGGGAARFFDIPIGTEAGGIFRTATTVQQGSAFSKRLAQACSTNFGTALPAFMEALFQQEWKRPLKEYFSHVQQKLVVDEDDALTLRGSDVFAAIAAAGLLACDLNITPWKPDSVLTACQTVFDCWRRRNELLPRKTDTIDPAERLAAATKGLEIKRTILATLEQPIPALSDLRDAGVNLDPNDAKCPAFLYTKGDEQAVCLSALRFRQIVGVQTPLHLRCLKLGSFLMINGSGDGYKLTVNVGPDKETASFIAIRL